MTPPETAPVPTDVATAFRIDGRLAVVTGAASGIGRQTAHTFAEAGARLVLADTDEAGLADAAAEVEELGAEVVAVPTDVSSKAAVDALGEVAAGLGVVNVWANVAGILRPGSVLETDEQLLNLVLAVNLGSVVWGSAAAGRAMMAAGRGSIINVASAAGEMAAPGGAAYGASKAGVISVTRTLAVELGPHGVRANAVAPGMIDTPMTAQFLAASPTANSEGRGLPRPARAPGTPIGTIGEPVDVALCILYLASDASRFVTGQVLRPNGGLVLG